MTATPTTITSETAIADRRGFLKLAGASAVTGASTAVGATAAFAAPPEKPADAMYQETEHVRRYYELAR